MHSFKHFLLILYKIKYFYYGISVYFMFFNSFYIFFNLRGLY